MIANCNWISWEWVVEPYIVWWRSGRWRREGCRWASSGSRSWWGGKRGSGDWARTATWRRRGRRRGGGRRRRWGELGRRRGAEISTSWWGKTGFWSIGESPAPPCWKASHLWGIPSPCLLAHSVLLGVMGRERESKRGMREKVSGRREMGRNGRRVGRFDWNIMLMEDDTEVRIVDGKGSGQIGEATWSLLSLSTTTFSL